MKTKIKCIWFKPSGKYYTDGEGELEVAAFDRFHTVGDLQAFHIALMAAGAGQLPGLSGRFTGFAMTMICEDKYPHHFAAGTFEA